jgi:hypothetical protein
MKTSGILWGCGTATSKWSSTYGKLLEHFDSTSNDNDGTRKGVGEPAYTSSGKVNGAQDFDETSEDYIDVGTSGLSASAGTVEAWVKTDGVTADGLHDYIFGHTTQPSYANRIQIYLYDENRALGIGLGDQHETHINIETFTIGTWYHAVLTWDGTNYEVFVDGVSKANGSYSGLSSIHTSADIGNNGEPTARDESWNGIMDEFRVSDIVRSAAWIQTEYNNQKAPAAFYTVGIEETQGTGAEPFHNGWQYSKKITILASEVAADLTNFPVLIKTTDADWADTLNSGNVAQADGGDILFIAGDGTTKLDHEIERYDETTGELVAWVEVRSLSGSQDTDI